MAMIAVIVSMNLSATNSVSLGMDSLRINPNRFDGYVQLPCSMTIDGYCDTWNLRLTYPDGLMPRFVGGVMPLEGMTVSYVNAAGESVDYTAPLNIGAGYATISSHIGVDGYWDYNFDGVLESYGTAKWEPGSYNVFEFCFYVSPSFRQGWLTMEGMLDASPDRRGAILANVVTYTRVWCWAGYMKGDVDGNEAVQMGDLSTLINYLLTGEGLDEFGIAAADVKEDGRVDMDDMTWLINYLLNSAWS